MSKELNLLYSLTRSLVAGVVSAWTRVRSVLPGLYLTNRESSELDLIYEGDFPRVYPESTGEFLDRLGYMFDVARIPGELDDDYRVRIIFALKKNSTKSGISANLELIFSTVGMEVDINISESFNGFFDGTSSTFDAPMRSPKGSLLYGVVVFIHPRIEYMYSAILPGETEPQDLGGTYFAKVQNNYFRAILDAFQVDSFANLLNTVVASGVHISRVVFVEPGAGGSRYILP